MSHEPEKDASSATSQKPDQLFPKLNASEGSDQQVTVNNGVNELESLCMNCYKQGHTKLMLTKIPFYRDVVISSFQCEHCHYKNTGIDSANKIQEKGVHINLLVDKEKDLNREVVKSDYAKLTIPQVELEIPAKTQQGVLTTIEGVIDRVISNLEMDIEMRKASDKETTDKLEIFKNKLGELKKLKLGPFNVIIDDPSGDSFIENPNAPKRDLNLNLSYFKRTDEQNEMIGLFNTEQTAEEEAIAANEGELDQTKEVINFRNNCPNCNAICDTHMKMTDIPYFKSVIIMCTVCDTCGVRSNEVKSGSGISEKGIKYTLKITDASDLNRDFLKSETASIEIPSLDFYMESGTLGGKFTTVEGILKDCYDQLNMVSPFGVSGDSVTKEDSGRMKIFLDKLELIKNGQVMDVTLILDDPSGNSYIQNVYAPEEDPNLTVEYYERNYDQNEVLGINDMKTENYQNEEEEEEKTAAKGEEAS